MGYPHNKCRCAEDCQSACVAIRNPMSLQAEKPVRILLQAPHVLLKLYVCIAGRVPFATIRSTKIRFPKRTYFQLQLALQHALAQRHPQRLMNSTRSSLDADFRKSSTLLPGMPRNMCRRLIIWTTCTNHRKPMQSEIA